MTIEQTLNQFYVNASAIVEDLTLCDSIRDDETMLRRVATFVTEVRQSYDTLRQEGYAAAWPHLEAVSVGFIGLCRYKDRHLPNLDRNLSRECAETYRALPDPVNGAVVVDATKVQERYVLKTEKAYRGQGDLGGESLEQPKSGASLFLPKTFLSP